MVSLRRFYLPCLLALSGARAAEQDTLFAALYTPPLEGAPSRAIFSLGWSLSTAKYFTSINSPLKLVTDVERSTFSVSASVQPQPDWSLSAQLPVHLYWGGVINSVVKPYHDAIGFPRSPGEVSRTLIYVAIGEKQQALLEPSWGVGDLTLSLAHRMGSSWMRASLGLPTGDPARFLGSGGYRASLATGVDFGHWGAEGQVSFPLGDNPALDLLSVQPALGGNLWWDSPWAALGRWQLSLASSPFWGAGIYGSAQLSVGVSWGPFNFSEDLSPGLPDAYLRLAGRWER